MDGQQFRIDIGDERLFNGHQPIQITNKAFQLLRIFVENPNRLLTKHAILDMLWPSVHVSEALIKEYVHDLRAALGDDPKQPKFIETVHGRGYRFHGGIEISGKPGRALLQTGQRSGPPSVAVLPLENLEGSERWQRFCLGVSDDLITDLARFPDLLVIAKSSSFAYQSGHTDVREIGQALGASYILEGSIQASNCKLRVNLQLVETKHGHHVWAQRYERDLGDLFEIQSDIVSRVAAALAGFEGRILHTEKRRLGRKPPQDLEVYELYLLGYELEERFEKESTLKAFDLLQRAVDRDPSFSRAWLVLGWTCWQIASEGWDPDTEMFWRLEREAMERAAALDPLDPLALLELAALKAVDGDELAAREGLERAFDLGRNQADVLVAISKYLIAVADDAEWAVQALQRGLQLNKSTPEWYFMVGARVAYLVDDFEVAINYAKKAPKNLSTQIFELLAMVRHFGADQCSDKIHEFETAYPDFDPHLFMRDPPITAPAAKERFMEGFKRARLG